MKKFKIAKKCAFAVDWYDEDHIMFTADYKVGVINLETGAMLWKQKSLKDYAVAAVCIKEGNKPKYIVVCETNKRILVLNAITGEIERELEI